MTSMRPRGGSRSRCFSREARAGATASRNRQETGSFRPSSPYRPRWVAEPVAILVAARDEERVIAATVATLRNRFPGAEVIVADDGSRDETAARAEAAGARVLRLPRRGKGQALTMAEQAAAPGPLLLCDADLTGDLGPLLESDADLAIAAFSER